MAIGSLTWYTRVESRIKRLLGRCGIRRQHGQDLLVAERFNITRDNNGDLLLYPEGDRSVPPSGRMPVGGFVFNAIHNVQAKTPVENIAAMIDAVKEFNGL